MSEAEWEAWDRQIKEDLEAGRFDKLLKQAHNDHKNGLTFSFEEGKRRFYQSHLSIRRNDEQQ